MIEQNKRFQEHDKIFESIMNFFVQNFQD